MAERALTDSALYFQARGLRTPAPGELSAAMRLALDSMRVALFGRTTEELTGSEQTALRRAGMDLEERSTPDPLMKTAAKFAAVLETSLSPAEAAKRLKMGAGRLRQLIADRSVYSIRLEGRRYIPLFQFQDEAASKLVPNIGPVNRALDPALHPVEVLNWYTGANPDLFLGDDIDATASPLDWLKAGHPLDPVLRLAELL